MRPVERLVLALASVVTFAGTATAQTAADGPVLRRKRVLPDVAIKIWMPAGNIRFVAWDKDSVVLRGRVAPGEDLFYGGDSAAMKFGVDTREENSPKSRLVAYVPRQAKLSVKAITANIDGSGVSGWFYTVGGAIHLSGAATSIEAESMTGNIDLDVTTPWLKARGGDGHVLVRGAPQDVDASTIGGTLDIAAASLLRGQFGTVSGDIHYAGSPARGGIFEFTSHSGSIELLVPRSASGVFALSSIMGRIENGLASIRPTSAGPKSLRFSVGRGDSQVTARTFKGNVRIRTP